MTFNKEMAVTALAGVAAIVVSNYALSWAVKEWGEGGTFSGWKGPAVQYGAGALGALAVVYLAKRV